MNDSIQLTGIAWDHSRALPPLVAASQRYEELNPGRRICWDKRSLNEFGHMPIDVLADHFDFIVIDHPWAGFCFARDLVHDLRPIISMENWERLRSSFIGSSFESYLYEEKLLAIPIDAATPTPSWRPDLMRKHNQEPPQNWDELLSLADRGLATMPGFPPDLFLNWSMLLEALQARPFTRRDQIADTDPAHEAMDLLKRLSEKMPESIYESNPIRLAEQMTQTDEIAYCAFAYSYGNYSRPSFVEHPLSYGGLVSLNADTALRSIIGGTGLSITKHCTDIETALDFALFCASAEVQKGVYAYSGGQPAHREAWDDPALDSLSNQFFSGSRVAHEQAIVRPRYDGYVPHQEAAGKSLQSYLRNEITRGAAWEDINDNYRRSLSVAL